MKINFKIFLTILIVSGLAFGSVISAGFAKPAFIQTPQEIVQSNSANLPAVQVISLPANPFQLIMTGVSPAVKDCQASFAGSQNLIQDAAKINLNQPAGCFLLTLGRVVSQQQLAVRPLNYSPVKVAVAIPPRQVLAFGALGQPVSSSLPQALPLAGLALLAPFWQLGVKLRRGQTKLFGFLRPAIFGFNGFEILRC